MHAHNEDLSGALLADRYRIVREIGRGSVGVVYEARHTFTGRRVALKVLKNQHAGDGVIQTRFLREAESMVAVEDPHVVDVLDMGRTPEHGLFLVFEYLDGVGLNALIQRESALPVERAAHIGTQLAAVMGKAHAQGIVHRDLKPANVVLIPRDGDPDYVKVIDFGIARVNAPVSFAEPEDESNDALTMTRQIMGTPMYMPPEQFRSSRHVDARADVYAMGVILYKMLTGVAPFEATGRVELFAKVLAGTVRPPIERRPEIPRELSDVVMRAMSRDPEARFKNGTELAEALVVFTSRRPLSEATVATLVSDDESDTLSKVRAPDAKTEVLSAPEVVSTTAPAPAPTPAAGPNYEDMAWTLPRLVTPRVPAVVVPAQPAPAQAAMTRPLRRSAFTMTVAVLVALVALLATGFAVANALRA
jgi:serine/threonine-protein kinase